MMLFCKGSQDIAAAATPYLQLVVAKFLHGNSDLHGSQNIHSDINAITSDHVH